MERWFYLEVARSESVYEAWEVLLGQRGGDGTAGFWRRLIALGRKAGT